MQTCTNQQGERSLEERLQERDGEQSTQLGLDGLPQFGSSFPTMIKGSRCTWASLYLLMTRSQLATQRFLNIYKHAHGPHGHASWGLLCPALPDCRLTNHSQSALFTGSLFQ